MAWLTRLSGRAYYYRKHKQAGRVVSEYIGTGAHAALMARFDQLEREKRQEQREAWRRQMAAMAAVDGQIAEFHRYVRRVVADVLQSAGYHQHKRGEWRKKRTMTTELATTTRLAEHTPDSSDTVLYTAVLSVVLKGTGGNEKTQNVMRADLEQLRQRLGWAEAAAHEKLLIEHVCLCWLRVQIMENHYSNNTTADNYTIRKAEHFEKSLSRTHGRYLQAVETLARVRRLLHKPSNNVAFNFLLKQQLGG